MEPACRGDFHLAVLEHSARIAQPALQFIAGDDSLGRFGAGRFPAFDGAFHLVNQADLGSEPDDILTRQAGLSAPGSSQPSDCWLN